jgi:hypothetical protein
MTLASLARAMGPALSGSLWAWCTSAQLPGQQYAPFGLVSIMTAASIAMYSLVDLSVPAGSG